MFWVAGGNPRPPALSDNPENWRLIPSASSIKNVQSQRANKVVSDNPELVDFAIGWVKNSNYRRTVKPVLLIKAFWG